MQGHRQGKYFLFYPLIMKYMDRAMVVRVFIKFMFFKKAKNHHRQFDAL